MKGSRPIMADQIRGVQLLQCANRQFFGDRVSMARTEKSIAATTMTIHPLYECSLRIERKFAKKWCAQLPVKKKALCIEASDTALIDSHKEPFF